MGIEVTSVSRSPLALAKAPSALQVITDWEIRRSGATNLPEALRLASNLSVAQKNSHDWGISARGFNTELANKLLVMIDGRAVYTPLWSGVRWDVQDYLLKDIDRIEVVSGPGGSLWGENAANGVINVTTKTAADTQGLYVEAGGGNQLRDFEAVRYGGKLAPGVFFRVYTGWELEPSMRAQRDLGTDNMVWGAISRAVRTPSRIDRDVRQPSSGVVILAGSNRFESETLIAYEVGLRGQIGPRMAGSVSTFYHDYSKIRSLAPTPQTLLPFVILHDVQGHSHRLELSFDADLQKWWRLHGGYTFLRTELGVRPGGVDINNALNETADPENQIYLGSAMDLPHHVQLDAQLRWVDTLENNNNGQVGTVPSYADLTLRGALQVSDNLDASMAGHNLLHDQHPEFGVRGAARVEIRRSVFSKLAWRY